MIIKEFLTGENEINEYKSSFNMQVIESLTAFANTKGGKVYIGVSDSGNVVGVNVSPESVQQWINEIKIKTTPQLIPDVEQIEIDGKTVVLLSIEEYPIKPVAVKGRYFRRINNSNHQLNLSQISDLYLKTFNTSWDYYIDDEHSLDEISIDKIETLIEHLNVRQNTINESPLEFLKKLEFLRNDRPTKACFLLFTKNNTTLTTIELGRFQSDTVIKDSQRLQSDVLSEVEDVMAFIKKHINKEILLNGEIQNTENWQYPLTALRELVLNMIIHRDYASSADSVVKIFDDKIEFFNPGRLPANLTVKNLLANNYVSCPRNKLIANICKELGWIEKYGSGIRRVKEAFRKQGLLQPEFKEMANGFMVTVYSASVNTGSIEEENTRTVEETVEENTRTVEETVEENTRTVEETVEEIIAAIRMDPEITQNQLMKITGLSRRGIEWNLNKLKNQGRLKRLGSTKSGYWKVEGK